MNHLHGLCTTASCRLQYDCNLLAYNARLRRDLHNIKFYREQLSHSFREHISFHHHVLRNNLLTTEQTSGMFLQHTYAPHHEMCINWIPPRQISCILQQCTAFHPRVQHLSVTNERRENGVRNKKSNKDICCHTYELTKKFVSCPFIATWERAAPSPTV